MDTRVTSSARGSLPNAVFSGVINGAMQIPLCIALASVIFSGPMKPYLPVGIGLFLIGNALVSAIASLHSSSRYGLATIQDSTPAIIALMVVSIASKVQAQSSGLPTVVAAIAISTLAIGATFSCLGLFRLGIAARYFPPSVVSGYLAGTGIILILAGLGFLIDTNLTMFNLHQILLPGAASRWIPGVLFGISLTAIHYRFAKAWVLPVILFTSAIAFSLSLNIFHISLQEAVAKGWIQGGVGSGRLWPPLELSQLASVDLAVLGSHTLHYLIIAFVGSLALLLNVSALEQATEEELDLNRELRINGIANLIAGLFGGANGYLSISGSSLSHELKAPGRLPSLINASISIAALCFGVALLQIFPSFLLGGLTLFLGISMLKEPCLDNYKRFSRLEFGVAMVVALTIAYFGFVTGVITGLVISSIFFVVTTSRVSPIKFTGTCSSIQSQKVRTRTAAALLRLRGRDVKIAALQGAIFFGSAYQLYQHFRKILNADATSRPRFLLLEFKDVLCIDSSGLTWIGRLAQLAASQQVILVLSSLRPTTERHLLRFISKQLVSDAKARRHIRFAPEMEQALQWCEEQLLATSYRPKGDENGLANAAFQSLESMDQAALEWTSQFIEKAGPYLKREERPAGSVLWRAGEAADCFYLVLSGEASVDSISASGRLKQYFTVGPGSFIGETSFFTRQPRLGTVTTGCDSVLYSISREGLNQMSITRPELALELENHVLGIETLIVAEGMHSVDFMMG